MPGHPSNREGALPEKRALVVEVLAGTSVLDAASAAGFLIATRCGGVADCKTCIVELAPGSDLALSPMEPLEEKALLEIGVRRRSRLACQARVVGDAAVLVPDPTKVEDL